MASFLGDRPSVNGKHVMESGTDVEPTEDVFNTKKKRKIKTEEKEDDVEVKVSTIVSVHKKIAAELLTIDFAPLMMLKSCLKF